MDLDEPLSDLDCRALVVLARASHDPFLAPFFSNPRRLNHCFAVLPAGGRPRLGYFSPMERDEAAASGLEVLTPEALGIQALHLERLPKGQFLGRVLRRALRLCQVRPGRLAVAGCYAAGETLSAWEVLAEDGWQAVPGEELVAQARRSKTEEQMASTRQAADGVSAAFRLLAGLLARSTSREDRLETAGTPLTVGFLRQQVARLFADHGLTQPEGGILAPGAEGAVPHSPGDDGRILRPAESLVVDLFPKNHLFADCTRTFCVGSPPPALREAHAKVEEALLLAHARTRAGVLGHDLQRAVADLFEEAGYATIEQDRSITRGYVHGLGHGVGFELHELPSFRAEAGTEKGELREGDVVTLEPGLYDPEAGWGVRLEDMVVVGKEGVENLTPLPYALDPRAW